ncbi:MAG: hypothetical protein BWX98_02494 [Candidatus Aminicenantes bacterium ADurb.Bin147]|nr:MAG: hypothetical protein BWX98_02494 [Candidatus Aminicenantes bacterium ADurb.Bin147]
MGDLSGHFRPGRLAAEIGHVALVVFQAADHAVESVHQRLHLVPTPVGDFEFEVAQGRLPRSGQQAADGGDDHRPDPPGEDQDGADEENPDENEKFEQLPSGRRDLLLFKGEGQRQEQRGIHGRVGNRQRLVGKGSQLLGLGVIGMVFEGDPVLGFAVEKLRQEARLEQLLPAGGHKAASPVEVDVVGRGLGDPQDEIIGRRLGLRIFLPLEEEEIVDDVPGEGRLDFRLADKLLGEDPLEKTRGKESEEEKRNQGDGGEGDINAVGERPQGPETGAGLDRQPAPEQNQEEKGGRQRRVLEILHGQADGRRTGDQNGLNPIRPAEGIEIEAFVLVAESGPYSGSVQGGIAGQG